MPRKVRSTTTTRLGVGRTRSRNLLRAFWTLLAALSVATSTSAHATLFVAPARPLTEDEALENAVTRSDAIVIGTVTKAHTDISDRNGEAAALSEVRLQVAEIRKGKPNWRQIIVRDGAVPILTSMSKLGIRLNDSVVMFLHHGKQPSPEFWVGDNQDTMHIMYPVQSPHGVAGGMRRLDSPAGRNILAKLEHIQASLTLEAMTRDADLVIIGRPLSASGPCVRFEQPSQCRLWEIETVLKGQESRDSIPAFGLTRLAFPQPPGSQILFLRQSHGQTYEIMHFRRGLVGIHDNYVPEFDMGLSDVMMRITRAGRSLRP